MRFNSSQACTIKPAGPAAAGAEAGPEPKAQPDPKEAYFKKGANVALGEKYKVEKLSNGVNVFTIDKSGD